MSDAGLTGAFFASTAGLDAQSRQIGSISENIANVNTVGYKSTNSDFISQLSSALSIGGVTTSQTRAVSAQGLINNTGNNLDMALNGNGFFVVNSNSDNSGSFLYTRAGSFTENSEGYLENAAGYFLQGWPLNSNGDLPGTPGNVDTTSNALLASTTAVKINEGSGTAQATTTVTMAANLDAGGNILTGAGETAKVISLDSVNTDLPASDILLPTTTNGKLTVGDTLQVSTGAGLSYTYKYGGFDKSNDITTGILGASTLTGLFTGATAGDNFTIATGTSTVTLTYEPTGANPSAGTFNSLQTLADAINAQPGLTARTDGTKYMYVSATNANAAVTFTDVQGTFVNKLGLTNLAATTNTFNSLGGLQTLVSNSQGLLATINNAETDASDSLNVQDPLDTITFTNTATNTGNFLYEFGMVPAFATNSVGPVGPVYNSAGTGGGNNMASGVITPQFSKNLQVVDSLGVSHNFTIGFIKIGNNSWAAEVWDASNKDIVTSNSDSQVAAGIINFNGDGSLASVSSGLSQPIKIVWSDDAAVSEVSLNLGTAGPIAGTQGATQYGQTNGLSQFAGGFQSQSITSNGAETGQLNGVQITADGYVVANYSNGQSIQVYKLPIATFNNPDGLTSLDGNVFAQSVTSGEFNLKEAGNGGAATVVPDALEQTDVDLSSELTNMLIVQRAYDSSSEVIKTVDSMLDDLKNL